MDKMDAGEKLLAKIAAAFAQPDRLRQALRLREEAQYLIDLADRVQHGSVGEERPLRPQPNGLGFDTGREAYDIDQLRERVAFIESLAAHRSRILGLYGFTEQRWSLAMYVFARQLEGAKPTLLDACEACGISYPTALNHAGDLADGGFFRFAPEAGSSRSGPVSLTPDAILKMIRFFMRDRISGEEGGFHWPVLPPLV